MCRVVRIELALGVRSRCSAADGAVSRSHATGVLDIGAPRSEPVANCPVPPSTLGHLMTAATTTTVVVPGTHLMTALVGPRDQFLRRIEQAFPNVLITVRGNEVRVDGDDTLAVAGVSRLFEELVTLLQTGQTLDDATLERIFTMVRADENPAEILGHNILKGAKGRQVKPKTGGQKRYVDAIANNVITFGIGPAGTGKSWLAVAMAVRALQAKQVQRIILTRPGGRGGRAARLPPRRPHGQDRPVPATAVRRAVRHARPRGGDSVWSRSR